ncbi:MAG: 50S ribosomal protein L25/general stress protein Ctc [Gemmatimonadetes bacterium]|nr:50S ribosomal protein L25/general stress protein Ctc [Gemmatimonadota bacterium]
MAKSAMIQALPRDRTGKGAARSARREGRIPAVLYGHGEDSLPLAIDAHSFGRLLHEVSVENTLLDLAFDGQAPMKVLVREVQRHPYRNAILHVDFFHVSMQEKITVSVPVVLEGTPVGVRLNGGILDHAMRDVEVVCLPNEIPESIEIDVSSLAIGDAVRVSDLNIPNAQFVGDPDRTVVSVVPPTVMEEPTVEVDEAAGPEPEVIAKGKEEEPGAPTKKEGAPTKKEGAAKEKK